MNEEERLQTLLNAAWNTEDVPLVDFYLKIQRDLKNLREVGEHAARIWTDHSDEDAWDKLYDALLTAGLLDTEEPNETT